MTVLARPTASADERQRPGCGPGEARVALLGLGTIGSAVANLLANRACAPDLELRLAGALVRTAVGRHARTPIPLFTEPLSIFDAEPDVVVEVLGGLEPARTIVLEALSRRIPVVTANKTLVAVHGDELLAAAARSETPFRMEAAVVAGVPFLGTFTNRPLASAVDRVTAIVNGTSNFVLSHVDEGIAPAEALVDAQRQGFAEPDPSKDLDGSDAAEKLAILLRHFARLSIQPSEIYTSSIDRVGLDEMKAARELGGRIKPLACAAWTGEEVDCFAGPAFLFQDDPLAALDGALNGVRLERRGSGPVHLTGPGAGPDVTARTILDDVFEVLAGRELRRSGPLPRARISRQGTQGWFVSLRATRLPHAVDLADLLAAHGVWVRRWGAMHTRSDADARALLTFACAPAELHLALTAVVSASGCIAKFWPIVEVFRD